LRRFLHRAGAETGGFRIATPRFAVGEQIMTAAGESGERNEKSGAVE
jgi:hypothetical protein